METTSEEHHDRHGNQPTDRPEHRSDEQCCGIKRIADGARNQSPRRPAKHIRSHQHTSGSKRLATSIDGQLTPPLTSQGANHTECDGNAVPSKRKNDKPQHRHERHIEVLPRTPSVPS